MLLVLGEKKMTGYWQKKDKGNPDHVKTRSDRKYRIKGSDIIVTANNIYHAQSLFACLNYGNRRVKIDEIEVVI